MRYDPENYGSEPWREPTPDEGDTVIFSEFGRSLDNTNYKSHWFMLVSQRFGGYALLVKHGGGQERINLGYLCFFRKGHPRIIDAMKVMDTDALYLMLYTFYDIHTDTRRSEQAKVTAELKTAFAEGRLKKRKVRGQAAYKVTVEQKQATQNPA